jgi:CHAT domain-containing protein/tetratricopeptide (TPR) repeat protein
MSGPWTIPVLADGLAGIVAVVLGLMIVVEPASAQTGDLTALNNRINELARAGKYAEATPLAEKMLGLARAQEGEDSPDTAASLGWLAELYEDQGRYSEAEPLMKSSLAIAEKALGPEDPSLGRARNNLAELYEAQGRYTDAEPLMKRALAITEKALGPEHPDVGACLDNLAALYVAQARYTDAEPLYKRALDIVEKALPVGHPDIARSLGSLAELYEDQGRYDEAEPLMKEALGISEKALGPEHPTVGIRLNNLAELYVAQVRYSEAEPLMERSLAIGEKALGREHPDVGMRLSNLAALYFEQRRYGEAEPLMKSSLAIAEKTLGPEHPTVGIRLSNLAELYDEQGRYGEAETLLNRALAIDEKVLGPEHPSTGIHLSNLSGLHWEEHKWDLAFAQARRATDIYVHQVRTQSSAAEKERTRDGSRREPAENRLAFQWLIKAAWPLSEEKPDRRAELNEAAFAAAQWANLSSAGAALVQMAARFAKGQGPLADRVRELQILNDEAAGLDRRLIAAVSSPPELRSPQDEQTLRTRLADIDGRLKDLNGRLEQDFPDYANLANPEPLSLAETQAILFPNEALIEFTFAGDDGFAWMVTKTDTPRWVRLANAGKAVPDEVQALRCGLDSAAWRGDGEARCKKLLSVTFTRQDADAGKPLPFNFNIAYDLYKGLFGEFEQLLPGKRLLIVPSGALTSLPLHVLITEKPVAALASSDANDRKASWLARSHALTTLPSVASLKALRRTEKSAAPQPYMAFGNPLLIGRDGQDRRAFDKQACPELNRPLSEPVAAVSEAINPAIFFDREPANVEHLRRQAPLPETADELCAVARSLGATRDVVYLGARATEKMVKTLSADGKLGQARVVHFATHGLLARETVWFAKTHAEPALLLTPPEQASDEDNGLLMASEVAQLTLNADWVIMSACNTAAGEKQDAEALSGLARAFFYAGARALLVSHWYVDSQSSVALTTAAIADMRADHNLGRAEALQHAMLALIDRGGRWAQPANWAPFVVVGEAAAAR